MLVKKNLSSSVGDEGGFAPSLDSDESAIELILSAIHNAGFKAGEDVIICLDVASNELYEKNKYKLPLSLKTGDKLRILGVGAYTSVYVSNFNALKTLKEYYLDIT